MLKRSRYAITLKCISLHTRKSDYVFVLTSPSPPKFKNSKMPQNLPTKIRSTKQVLIYSLRSVSEFGDQLMMVLCLVTREIKILFNRTVVLNC
jgi:hypothetical protein